MKAGNALNWMTGKIWRQQIFKFLLGCAEIFIDIEVQRKVPTDCTYCEQASHSVIYGPVEKKTTKTQIY